MRLLRYFEVGTLVAASFVVAFATEVLTLGLVRLKMICQHCQHEIELRNIWSHMRWHVRRGEWK